MTEIQHPNVLRAIEIGENVLVYADNKKDTPQVMKKYIITEIADGGELFDWVVVGGKFGEPLARFYFKQLIEGIKVCHKIGIVHRDLKCENLLLDKDLNLKIADFGMSGPI